MVPVCCSISCHHPMFVQVAASLGVASGDVGRCSSGDAAVHGRKLFLGLG